jgi:DNA-binding beta-propeller fold protein YncE
MSRPVRRSKGARRSPHSLRISFGGPGSGDGELNDPAYLTVDAQDHVLVPDWGTNRIVTFASDGTFLNAWGGPGADSGAFSSPVDVVVDDAGNIYVADLDNGRIQVFAADGGFLAAWDAGTTPLGSSNLPFALALDGDGHLYVVGVAADYNTAATLQKFQLPAPIT